MTQTRDLISASVTTSLILRRHSRAIGGLGFVLVKLPAPLFWGVAMAFFSLVPVVGLRTDLRACGVVARVHRALGRAILLVVICAGVSAIVDNVLRPLFAGRAIRIERVGDLHQCGWRRRLVWNAGSGAGAGLGGHGSGGSGGVYGEPENPPMTAE